MLFGTRALAATGFDHQAFQQLEVLGKQFVGALHRGHDELSQRIDGLQQEGRQRRGQDHRAGAQSIEHIFNAMRELRQRREAKSGGVALDGVGRPVQELPVRMIDGPPDLADPLRVLLQERLDDIAEQGVIAAG